MCRQVLAEFAGADPLTVILANDQGERTVTTLQAIFPGVFDKAQLLSGQK
jgi:cytidine deaminase